MDQRRKAPAVGLALLVFLALSGCKSLPKLEEALANARALAQSSKVFDADGKLLKILHAEENRENVPLAQVPAHVRQAVIAIEDERFYQHAGVDGRAVARAFFKNTQRGKVIEGGSTITQQYIKNTLVTSERTLKRKIQEAALAYQMEQRYSKDKILELYLNTVYFGEGAYGIEAAALTYFNVRARRLSLTQGALLAGLIRSPTRYDPLISATAGLARRNLVLGKMLELDFITKPVHDKAVKEKLIITRGSLEKKFPAPYFVTYVETLIQQDPQFSVLGKTVAERTNSLFKGGLRIHTTIDMRMQAQAEKISREILYAKRDPKNAFVAVDPNTGHIVAMIGGRDFFDAKDPQAKFNLATQSRRQPGSAFKTFVLVAALEKGISIKKIYRGGSRVTIPLGGGAYWSPGNYEGISFGGSLSLQEATYKSVNVVYAQVAKEIGAKAIVDTANRMGITSLLEPFLSISLGTEEVSPLEMAGAYATLANGGFRVPVTPITKITDAAGKVLWEPTTKRERVLDPAIVAIATDTLKGVIEKGTGRRVKLDRPAAGKTGTSEEYNDAWFAGFTPQMVGVSWLGFPKKLIPMVPPRTRIKVVGGSWPGQIWKEFMLAYHKSLPIQDFPYDPKEVVRIRVDTTRGCVAPGFAVSDTIQDRYFMRGTEPARTCDGSSLIGSGIAPNVTGRLVADAVDIMRAAGFEVSTTKVYCPAYPTGYVCRQSPSGGTYAGTNRSARLEISDDSAVTDVPQVLGLTASAAQAKLEEAGFTVSIVRLANAEGYPGCRQPEQNGSGYVWLMNPCAGAQAGAGSIVRITVNP